MDAGTLTAKAVFRQNYLYNPFKDILKNLIHAAKFNFLVRFGGAVAFDKMGLYELCELYSDNRSSATWYVWFCRENGVISLAQT